jgi:uncharacterized membrane protein
MASANKHVEVNVPLSVAYNQWTQFEDWPQFMEGVKQVQQLDERRLQWRTEIAGKDEQFEVEITEQKPDERIAWRSLRGAKNAGVVTFHYIAENRTRVTLQMDYEPEGVVEKTGSALGVVDRRVQGDLERFKEFLESRGRETGAWRGKIDQPRAH